MTYQFDRVQRQPVILAVTEASLPYKAIPNRILDMFKMVYTWLHTAQVQQTGQNHALYDQFGLSGVRMRVGFPVSEHFTASDTVQCLTLDGGEAAHTTHYGAYRGLPEAHSQLNAWCDAQSIQCNGVALEVYGDWHDDETQLVTEIYRYL